MTPNIFLISGTPGTGKTSIVKELHKTYNYSYVSIGDVVIAKNLFTEEDKIRKAKIVDPVKFNHYFDNFLENLKGDLILECHYADMIIHPSIKIALVLRCHPENLKKRLLPRNYSDAKIHENSLAELLGDSTSYMLEKEHLFQEKRIFEIDTSNKSIQECAEIIHKILQNPENFSQFLAGTLSWLSDKSVPIKKYIK